MPVSKAHVGPASSLTTDQQILALRTAGHLEHAFDLLMRSYQDKAMRLAYSILGDATSAEDGAQEAFVRIWKALPTFRGDSALSSWIYSVVRNTCLTHVAARKPEVALTVDVAAPRDQASLAALDVPRLLAALRPEYQQVVRLFYLEERSYDEVAAALDLPLGTVKTYLFRARKELLELWQSAPQASGHREIIEGAAK